MAQTRSEDASGGSGSIGSESRFEGLAVNVSYQTHRQEMKCIRPKKNLIGRSDQELMAQGLRLGRRMGNVAGRSGLGDYWGG